MRSALRNSLSLLTGALLFAAGAVSAVAAPNVTRPKIGVLLSFSGGLEQWCGYIRKGMEVALAEAPDNSLQLLFEDDRSIDRRAAATAAHKLIDVDNVDLLYTWTASTLAVLKSPAVSNKVPLFVGAFDRRVAEGGPYVFGAFVNYELTPREAADFLLNTKGAKRLALITTADDWSLGFEAPFKDELRKLGAELVLNENVSTTETDLRPIIGKLKALRADAVLAPLYGDSLFAFLKQARELKYEGAINVGDGMFEEDLKVAGSSAEGVYAMQIWLRPPQLAAAIKARYGEDSNALQLGLAATGYDFIKHLKGAVADLEHSKVKVTRESLRTELAHFKSMGLTGEMMVGAPPVASGEIMTVVKDGRYVPVAHAD